MCFLGIGSGSVSYRMVHDMVCSWHCKLLVFFRAISKQAIWTITSIGWPKLPQWLDVTWLSQLGVGLRAGQDLQKE